MKRASGNSRAGRLVALGIAMVCIAYLVSAWQFPLGSMQRPGAGFFPQVVGALGLVLAMVAAAIPSVQQHTALDRPVVVFVAALLVFSAILNSAGFVLAGVLFTAVLARLLGANRLWQVGGISIIAPIALDALFTHGFGIALPRGVLAGLY